MEYWNLGKIDSLKSKADYSTDTIGVLKLVTPSLIFVLMFHSTDTIGVLKPGTPNKFLNSSIFHRYNWSIETSVNISSSVIINSNSTDTIGVLKRSC